MSRPSAAASRAEFAKQIPGAEDDPSFFATGISLVAHMANPHVPAVHMNTRFLTTTRRWFGGGADLNPAIPYQEDTDAFHARLRAACAAHDPTFYPRFSKWAEEYFWLPHRDRARGVGGIFYDRLEDHFDEHFAFTRDVGEAFLDIFPQIVRKRMDNAVHRRRHGGPARIPRPLRRVQPALRPRHLVRPQDRRQHRRDPDEPAAAGEVDVSDSAPRRLTSGNARPRPRAELDVNPRQHRRVDHHEAAPGPGRGKRDQQQRRSTMARARPSASVTRPPTTVPTAMRDDQEAEHQHQRGSPAAARNGREVSAKLRFSVAIGPTVSPRPPRAAGAAGPRRNSKSERRSRNSSSQPVPRALVQSNLAGFDDAGAGQRQDDREQQDHRHQDQQARPGSTSEPAAPPCRSPRRRFRASRSPAA